LIFGENMDKSKMAHFFSPSCIIKDSKCNSL